MAELRRVSDGAGDAGAYAKALGYDKIENKKLQTEKAYAHISYKPISKI